VARTLDVDYLVVGAGAMGMAFTDALIDHADVRVALVDRRDGVGGHWLDDYAFVRLHQASTFYGVASTPLGHGVVQQHGPEAGLHERASGADVCAHYARVLNERMLPSGKVEFLPSCDYADGRVTSRVSGQQWEVPARCRVVDAHYLAPDIPSRTPPPFEVADGARVIAVNDVVRLEEAPSQYVVVGSGKTATDTCIWLLARGVDPDAICWVRPRDPWMLNRALVQPDPGVYLGMVADMWECAAVSSSLDELFLRLEDAGIMLRIDRSVTPTMAKAPTLGTWELELLRTLENVVRLGHIRRVEPGRLTLSQGSVDIANDAVVIHCAASGLKYPTRIPIWGETITLQAIRAGFPCFGAALAGYVEATRSDDDVKNRLCPPSSYGNSLTDWAVMNVLGARASASFSAAPDIAAWANGVLLNPARVAPELVGTPAVDDAAARLQTWSRPGVARLAELAGLS
jgi:hypothetical protein